MEQTKKSRSLQLYSHDVAGKRPSRPFRPPIPKSKQQKRDTMTNSHLIAAIFAVTWKHKTQLQGYTHRDFRRRMMRSYCEKDRHRPNYPHSSIHIWSNQSKVLWIRMRRKITKMDFFPCLLAVEIFFLKEICKRSEYNQNLWKKKPEKILISYKST